MTNKPHLLWIYTESPEDALDAATWLETTRELRTLGWRVTLVTPAIHGLSGERLVRDVPVVYVPRPNLYLFGQILFHWNLLRRLLGEWRSVDVVLLHQMSLLWMMPIKLLRWLRFGPGWGKQPQLVMDTRDLNPVEGGLKTKLRVWFYARMHQLANCCADGQTTITTQMAKLVNVPPAKLWGTWPSGVTPESFAPAVAMRRWPTIGEPLRLIYIGRLQQERNLLPLCQAVEKAHRAGMAFHFRLVGSGPQEAELRIFADQSNGCIEVLPPVAHAEIPALLGSAHIGVTSLPTVDNLKYQASSPVKIFEYLAAGMPILSTANACHTDVIGQGAFAFWAEEPTVDGLSAALAKAWAAREQLAHHSNAAQCAAQDWSWHAAAKKLGEALLHFRRGR